MRWILNQVIYLEGVFLYGELGVRAVETSIFARFFGYSIYQKREDNVLNSYMKRDKDENGQNKVVISCSEMK